MREWLTNSHHGNRAVVIRPVFNYMPIAQDEQPEEEFLKVDTPQHSRSLPCSPPLATSVQVAISRALEVFF